MDGCRNSRQYVRGTEIVKALQKSGCYVGCLEKNLHGKKDSYF